jgi:hypothetical protein
MTFTELHDKLKELMANPVFAEVSAEATALSKDFYTMLDKKTVKVSDEGEDDDQDYDIIESIKQLVKIYREKKEESRKDRLNLELKNIGEKKEILAEIMKVISDEENITKAYQKFTELKEKWRHVGPVPSEKHHELQHEFSRLSELFYYNMNIFKELRENDLKKNLTAKLELVEKLKKVAAEKNNQKELESALHVIQYQWEETGAVPKENWEEIRTQYWDAVKSINEKLQGFKKEREDKQQEALTQKLALIEKIKVLNSGDRKTLKDWEKDTDEILKIQNDWKLIGYAPREDNDRVWNEFRATCDIFFQSKKEFFSVINSVNDENKKKKSVLIEKAEKLKDSDDWKNTSKALIQLQEDWQKIGPAGKKFEHTMWVKFRAACDHFFNKRKESVAVAELQLSENLKKKEEFIASIETMEVAGTDEEKIAKLDEVSRQFRTFGDVPTNERDRLYNAFKIAIDKKYEQLNIDPSQKEMMIFKSKMESLKSSDNANFLFKKERDFIRGKINFLAEENVKLENNMGMFGKSKNAESMLKEYREKIEENKRQIDGLKLKLKSIPKDI